MNKLQLNHPRNSSVTGSNLEAYWIDLHLEMVICGHDTPTLESSKDGYGKIFPATTAVTYLEIAVLLSNCSKRDLC